MKNPVTILLLTVHLLAYTDIVQVFRFPNLIEHYQSHLTKNKSLGFIDFLVMHYGSCSDNNSMDDREDMQLPFKTIELHLIGNAIVSPQLTVISIIQPATYHSPYYSFYSPIISFTFKSSPFRPPIFSC